MEEEDWDVREQTHASPHPAEEQETNNANEEDAGQDLEEIDFTSVIQKAMDANFGYHVDPMKDHDEEQHGNDNDDIGSDDNNEGTDNQEEDSGSLPQAIQDESTENQQQVQHVNDNSGAAEDDDLGLDINLNDAINDAFKNNMDALLENNDEEPEQQQEEVLQGEQTHEQANEQSNEQQLQQQQQIYQEEDGVRDTQESQRLSEQLPIEQELQQSKSQEQFNQQQEEDDANLDLTSVINAALKQNMEAINQSEQIDPSLQDQSIDPSLREASIDPSLHESSISPNLQLQEPNEEQSSKQLENHAAAPAEDELEHAASDLNAAIANALTEVNQVDEQANVQRSQEDTQFDNLFNDIENIMGDMNEKHSQTTNTQTTATTSISEAMNQVDLNEVIQKSMTGGEEAQFDESNELQRAIADALKDHTKQQQQQQKPQKPRKPRKRTKKQTFDMNNAIHNSLRDSNFVDSNDGDLQRALEEIVHDVVENTLGGGTNDTEDLNWDSIMGNALQMAMNDDGSLLEGKDRFMRFKGKRSNKNLVFITDGSTKNIKGFLDSEKPIKRSTSKVNTPKPVSNETLINLLHNMDLKELDANKVIQSVPENSVDVIKKSVSSSISNLINSSSSNLKTTKISTTTPNDLSVKSNVSDVKAGSDSTTINSTSAISSSDTTLNNSNNNTTTTNTSANTTTTTTTLPDPNNPDVNIQEKKKLNDRERKKRWREFNTEKNRDLDLRTRVTKKAMLLFPDDASESNEMLREAWINSEFQKRKQKRIMKEQMKRDSLPYNRESILNLIPFELIFHDLDVIGKIVEVYNDIGGSQISVEKILSPTTDKSVILTSIATSLGLIFMRSLNDMNDKNVSALISTIVNTLNTFLDNNPSLSSSQSSSQHLLNYSDHDNQDLDEGVSINEKEAAIDELKKTMGLHDVEDSEMAPDTELAQSTVPAMETSGTLPPSAVNEDLDTEMKDVQEPEPEQPQNSGIEGSEANKTSSIDDVESEPMDIDDVDPALKQVQTANENARQATPTTGADAETKTKADAHAKNTQQEPSISDSMNKLSLTGESKKQDEFTSRKDSPTKEVTPLKSAQNKQVSNELHQKKTTPTPPKTATKVTSKKKKPATIDFSKFSKPPNAQKLEALQAQVAAAKEGKMGLGIKDHSTSSPAPAQVSSSAPSSEETPQAAVAPSKPSAASATPPEVASTASVIPEKRKGDTKIENPTPRKVFSPTPPPAATLSKPPSQSQAQPQPQPLPHPKLPQYFKSKARPPKLSGPIRPAVPAAIAPTSERDSDTLLRKPGAFRRPPQLGASSSGPAAGRGRIQALPRPNPKPQS